MSMRVWGQPWLENKALAANTQIAAAACYLRYFLVDCWSSLSVGSGAGRCGWLWSLLLVVVFTVVVCGCRSRRGWLCCFLLLVGVMASCRTRLFWLWYLMLLVVVVVGRRSRRG